ncbi:MAG: SLBB domain-containing protein [Acidobacteriota bacterium]
MRGNVKHSLVILCFLCCLIHLAGGTQLICQDAPTATPKETRSEEDLVHYGDVIDVDVVGGFEFDWRGTLSPEGFLDGVDGFNEPVYALCRSEAEVAASVAKAYSRILRNPQIVVRIIDRSNRAVVRLEGGVKTPTRFRLLRPINLRELIVLASGLTDKASGEISIFRQKNLSCGPTQVVASTVRSVTPDGPEGGGSQTIQIKISDLLSGKEGSDPQILSGDLITVTQALPIYVIGAVNNPRPIYAPIQTTISHAIASAGGLSKNSEGDKVTIFRREGGETKIIAIDLTKIKRGESDDEIVKPFDIIDVAAKGGGKRKYPPAVASGETKSRGLSELPLRVVD